MSKRKGKNILSRLSDIAKYLEEAGYVDKAKAIHNAMDALADDADYLVDFVTTTDEERNVGGPTPSYNGSLGGGGNFSTDIGAVTFCEISQLIKIANSLDQKGAYKEAGKIDKLINDVIEGKRVIDNPKRRPRRKKKEKKQNEDAIARSNGRVGTGVTDNQSAGMFQGFSDSYFYTNYGNLEGALGPTDR